MSRKRVAFQPKWEGPIRNWTLKFIKDNYWKYESQYEIDDLIQESYIKFLTIQYKYPEITAPQHFMALYKKAIINRFTDLARISSAGFTYNLTEQQEKQLDLDIESVDIISSIPEKLLKSFSHLLSPCNFKKLRRSYRRRTPSRVSRDGDILRYRETTNERFCKILELDANKVDIVTDFKEYLR